MTRYLHHLRIAFSIICGIACVLLVVLWVRSYWRFDQFIQRRTGTEYFGYTSVQGQLVFGKSNDPMLRSVFTREWAHRSFRMAEWDAALRGPVAFFPATAPGPNDSHIIRWPSYSRAPFVVAPGTLYREVILPYWLLFFLTTMLVAAPWFRWRFSLRTLLIAITLVAVVLGVIVWASA